VLAAGAIEFFEEQASIQVIVEAGYVAIAVESYESSGSFVVIMT